MNYIKQLEQDKREFANNINAADYAIADFQRLLNLPKHNGVDMNGDRSDWISTSDALKQLLIIRDALLGINQIDND